MMSELWVSRPFSSSSSPSGPGQPATNPTNNKLVIIANPPRIPRMVISFCKLRRIGVRPRRRFIDKPLRRSRRFLDPAQSESRKPYRPRAMLMWRVPLVRDPQAMIAAPIPANEADRLAALRALHILDTPPEERFDRIARLAARTFDVP